MRHHQQCQSPHPFIQSFGWTLSECDSWDRLLLHSFLCGLRVLPFREHAQYIPHADSFSQLLGDMFLRGVPCGCDLTHNESLELLFAACRHQECAIRRDRDGYHQVMIDCLHVLSTNHLFIHVSCHYSAVLFQYVFKSWPARARTGKHKIK